MGCDGVGYFVGRTTRSAGPAVVFRNTHRRRNGAALGPAYILGMFFVAITRAGRYQIDRFDYPIDYCVVIYRFMGIAT